MKFLVSIFICLAMSVTVCALAPVAQKITSLDVVLYQLKKDRGLEHTKHEILPDSATLSTYQSKNKDFTC